MTRDEVLTEVKRLSEQPVTSGVDLADSMREVSRLADTYINDGLGDERYLLEVLIDAHESFADRALTL